MSIGIATQPGQFAAAAAAPPSGLLLDSIANCRCAVSMRLLRTDYTGPCIRVRRSNGNVEADIGFSGGWLDETALLAHTGTGGTDAGYIVTGYDQSGNADHPTNPTPGGQPQIVAAGAVLKIGGKPAPSFDGTKWLYAQFASDEAQPTTYYAVASRALGQNKRLGFSANSTDRQELNFNSDNTVRILATTVLDSTATPDDAQHLYSALFDSTASELWIDGSLEVSGDAGTRASQGMVIGSIFNNANSAFTGTCQEALQFNADKSADMATINSNILAAYSI